ncbi:MAG: TonB-dependent receptor, partial [Gammaproteobacteria bacterium]|nr:TonB-dependent receptor [Gammaproteobacteria bacterium]
NLSWADRFDFELTYYDIEVDDAIQAVDAQTQLDACVSTLDSAFCGGINRNATGAIAGFNNTLTNIGGVETSGYDFNVVYSSPEYSFGRIGVAWFNTFVDEFTQILLDPTSPSGFRERRLDGIEENDSAIAEWQSTMNVDWRKGPWNASWTLRHISDLTESCSDFLDGTPNSFTALGLCSDPDPNGDGNETDSLNKLGSTTYHDIQVTYSFTSLQLDVTLGVENAFDKEPPLCFSCSLNGYDASTYDVPGRFFYVRAGIEFQ